MSGRFRHAPPEPRAEWIARPRLLRRLERRFELATLVITAPAGFGKTSALSQALATDADRPGRSDHWLQCQAGDADAGLLGAALLRTLGAADPPGGVVDARAIADVFLAASPDEVCLVIDDIHVLPTGSEGMELIGEVARLLPRNAHLVLSGRTTPPLALSRGLLHGDVEQLGSDALEFDDDELELVSKEAHADLGDAARWPALVALADQHPWATTLGFILEEVAGEPGSDRRTVLTALAHAAEIDRDLIEAAPSDPSALTELLSEMPLVQRSADGVFQLHDLWREALTVDEDVHPDPGVRDVLVRLAAARMGSGENLEAARLYVAAGNDEGLTAAAMAVCDRPLMAVSSAELRQMALIVGRHLPDHPVTGLLSTSVSFTGDETTSASSYESIARDAATSGDVEVEVLALYNAANMRAVVDPDSMPSWLADRADELVTAGHQAARVTSVMVRANQARAEGRPDDSVQIVGELLPPGSGAEKVVYSFGMNDAGRPEHVPAPEDLSDAAAAAMIPVAAAIWLRGDVRPDVAMKLGEPLLASTEGSGFAHLRLSVHATFSLVAQAAGDQRRARELADDALRDMPGSASVPARAFALLADAVDVVASGDDEEGSARLERLLASLPMGPWPARPYMYALPTMYAALPSVRPALDGCRLGPSLTVARDAGVAIAALVEHDDPAPAATLPWARPGLLRAHVLPRHLGLLSAAASEMGSPDVGQVLAELPDGRDHLARAAILSHAPTARWAAHRIATMPVRPSYDIRLDVLGDMSLARGDTLVSDRDWTNRERVRQLLAYLVLHRSVGRRSMAEALWPDLPSDRALGNLRVNLAHLQKVLQPGRETSDKAWFVRADAEKVALADDGVVVDATLFEAACDRARALEGEDRSSEALFEWHGAVDLYQGDFLEDWPDVEWSQVERFRLRTLAITARCRLGELLLARGEPEEAARHASIVLGIEPIQERACRLLVHALTAQGDRATALRAMRDLSSQLVRQGLSLEPATARLARSFGLTVLGEGT
ncbi:MAG: hypothetical protein GX643_16840 [Acidimicrobiales bacterium]|nr:hypothetical protein [Acidimicrobiales bacterium]